MSANETLGLLLCFVFLGAALILGTSRKWTWLVDPPEYLWPFYSQAFIKRFFGRRAVETFTYWVGAGLILFSLVALADELMLRFGA